MSRINTMNGKSNGKIPGGKMMKSLVKALEKPPTPPRRVDFFNEIQDFQCVILASLGLFDDAIAEITGLTRNQVRYRIQRSEANRGKGQPTSRAKYRKGQSEVVQTVISGVMSNKSPVKKLVTNQLDKQGLYSPNPNSLNSRK